MLQRLAYWWNETLPCRTGTAWGKALMWTHSTDHLCSLFIFCSLYLFDLFLAGVHLCPADWTICITQKDRQALIFSLPLLLSVSWHWKKRKRKEGSFFWKNPHTFTANKKICLLMRENVLLFHPHRELGQYKSGARCPSSAFCPLTACKSSWWNWNWAEVAVFGLIYASFGMNTDFFLCLTCENRLWPQTPMSPLWWDGH